MDWCSIPLAMFGVVAIWGPAWGPEGPLSAQPLEVLASEGRRSTETEVLGRSLSRLHGAMWRVQIGFSFILSSQTSVLSGFFVPFCATKSSYDGLILLPLEL